MLPNKKIFFCFFLVFFSVNYVYAGTEGLTLGELDSLNDEIAVLKKKLEIEKLKSQIKKAKDDQTIKPKKADSSSLGEFPPFFAPPASPFVPPSQNENVEKNFSKPEIKEEEAIEKLPEPEPYALLPVVISVNGMGNSFKSTLKYPDGYKITVRKNDILKGGYSVRDISENGVIMERNDKRYKLLFSLKSEEIYKEKESGGQGGYNFLQNDSSSFTGLN